MNWLSDVIAALLKAPPWIIVLLAGLLLIVLGALGKIGDHVDVGDPARRTMACVVGGGLLLLALVMPVLGSTYTDPSGSSGNGVKIPPNTCQVIMDAQGIVSVCTGLESRDPPSGCRVVRDDRLRVIACFM